MTQNKVTELNAWFDRQIELCNTQNKKLAADGYKDEAVFEKIKANVYDIFRTILSVAVKTNSTAPDKAKRFFETKLEQIPSGWVASCENAKQHNDTVNMHIEQLKLDTVVEIKNFYAEIMEKNK